MSELATKLKSMFAKAADLENPGDPGNAGNPDIDTLKAEAMREIDAGRLEDSVEAISGWASRMGVSESDAFANTVIDEYYGTPEGVKKSGEDEMSETQLEQFQKALDGLQEDIDTHEKGFDALISSKKATDERIAGIEKNIEEINETLKSLAAKTEVAGDTASAAEEANKEVEEKIAKIKADAEAEIEKIKSDVAAVADQPDNPKEPVTHASQTPAPPSRRDILTGMQKGLKDQKITTDDIQAYEANGILTKRAKAYLEL